MLKKISGKLEQATRLLFINTLTKYNNSILLVEYPKSGGTWLGQLISEYLDIPFPRNKFPGLGRSLYHGHYLPKSGIRSNKKIVLLVRDGRDVLVSQYHHQLIWNDKNRLNPKDVHYYREKVDFEEYENVKENMNRFIDFSFTHKPSKMQQYTFMGNWYTFNNAWMKQKEKAQNIYLVRYEDLLSKPHETMASLLVEFLGVSELDDERLTRVVNTFSFENQTKRKNGEENVKSFLRKGIHGDWKNFFEAKEKQNFKMHTHSMLIDFGYESTQNW